MSSLNIVESFVTVVNLILIIWKIIRHIVPHIYMLVVQLILIIWKIFHYTVQQLPINIYLVEILILTGICLAVLLVRKCLINKELTRSETLAWRYYWEENAKNKKLTEDVSILTEQVGELEGIIITLDYSQMEKQNKELTEQVNVSTQKVIALTEELDAKNVEINNNNINFHYWCNKYISEDVKNKSLSQDVITLNQKVITLTEEVDRLKYELEEMNPPTLNMCLNSLNEANEIIARMNERNNMIEHEEAEQEEEEEQVENEDEQEEEQEDETICLIRRLKCLKDKGLLGVQSLKFLSDNEK